MPKRWVLSEHSWWRICWMSCLTNISYCFPYPAGENCPSTATSMPLFWWIAVAWELHTGPNIHLEQLSRFEYRGHIITLTAWVCKYALLWSFVFAIKCPTLSWIIQALLQRFVMNRISQARTWRVPMYNLIFEASTKMHVKISSTKSRIFCPVGRWVKSACKIACKTDVSYHWGW